MRKLFIVLLLSIFLFGGTAFAQDGVRWTSCCPAIAKVNYENTSEMSISAVFKNYTKETQIFVVKFVFYDKNGHWLYETKGKRGKLRMGEQKSIGLRVKIPKVIIRNMGSIKAEVWQNEKCGGKYDKRNKKKK